MSKLGFVVPLFVPAHRPERFAKAAASGADAIILDLEDAVPLELKDEARSAMVIDFTDKPVLVRINAVGSFWYEEDLAAVIRLKPAAVILPKADASAISECGELRVPLVALIETARGLADARAVADSGSVARLAFGSIDYCADIGCEHERDALGAARAELVLASRLAGLVAPLDGVTLVIDDPVRIEDDARHARKLGFGGKLAIHPKQVASIIGGFAPSDEELAWARRVLASGDGAVALDGIMIDAPVRSRARAILARASRSAAD